MNNGKKRKKPIKNVVCDVLQCAYHDGTGSCTAEQISIGPFEADCCGDTVCATFKPRSAASGGAERMR